MLSYPGDRNEWEWFKEVILVVVSLKNIDHIEPGDAGTPILRCDENGKLLHIPF